MWIVVATDMALGAAIAGALGLVLRRRIAIWMYALSLAAIVITYGYERTAGTSRMLANRTALIATVISYDRGSSIASRPTCWRSRSTAASSGV